MLLLVLDSLVLEAFVDTSDMVLIDKIFPDLTTEEVLSQLAERLVESDNQWTLYDENKRHILGVFPTRKDAIAYELKRKNTQVKSESNPKLQVTGKVISLSEYEQELSIEELKELDEVLNYAQADSRGF